MKFSMLSQPPSPTPRRTTGVPPDATRRVPSTRSGTSPFTTAPSLLRTRQLLSGGSSSAAQRLQVPPGSGSGRHVGALVEVQDRGTRVCAVAGVLVPKQRQVGAPAVDPTGRRGPQRLVGQPGRFRGGVGVERRFGDVVIAEPEAGTDHLV